MNIDIEDKTIVISGGTSGLGKKMVYELTKEGANVVFGGRNQKSANQVLSDVTKNKGDAVFVHTDIVNAIDCKKLFDIAMNQFKHIDGFLNYAGITPISPLDTCSVETFDRVMDINFRAAFLCCQEAINSMRESGGGSIIIIGSPHAWSGDKDRAAYACSKGALITLMNHIAHNYAEENIRCNYLTMGWSLTEGEIELRKSQVDDVDEYFNNASNLIPMKRLCVPDDFVEQIVYLFSDASSMMTGSVLQMTAGYFV